MATYIWLFGIWGGITVIFLGLLFYRSRLTKNETDWIPLTDDAREDKAIQSQTITEKKVRRLTAPIRTLGAVSLVMLLVILGFWLYQGISTPPPLPQ